ncbi:hypothetical protein BH23CHL4_BH23CHL4_27460 [soil metagenome]
MASSNTVDHWARVLTGRKPKKSRIPKPSRNWGLLAAGAGCGAALMYFADPERGRRRRKVTVDRSTATIRQASRRVMRTERRAAAQVAGKAHQIRHFRDQPEEAASDQMLTDRILSQAFRDVDFPHDQVNINVEDRVAVLHGVLGEPEAITRLEEAVRKTPGVRRVESYLHLPGSPAPDEGPRH